MGDIRIRVGVALDANVRTVYQPLVAAAQQAAQNIMRALNTGAKLTVAQQTKTFQQMTPAIGHPYRDGAVQAEQAIKSVTKTAKQQADDMTKSVKKAADARVRAEREAMREIERELIASNRKQEAELEKSERYREQLRDRFARRFGHSAVHNGQAAIGMAARFAGDIAHGAGVQTNVGSMVHDYKHREELATALSTEGWIGAWGHPDTAINGSEKRMDPKDIMKKANQIALKTGTEGGATKIMEGMQSFLMKTGNLKQSVDMMEDLAIFAKATSTSMDDVLEGVGSLSNQLPTTMTELEKMESIRSVTRVLGGQGEIGAVHFRQISKGGNMSKLAGAASGFTLDESTRKTLESVGLHDKMSQNMAVMGALTQHAMKRGGRDGKQATLAANTAKKFIEDLSSKSTAKQWEAAFGAGAVYSDKGHTQLKDPKGLILAALDKTHGARDKIAKLMPNQVSGAEIRAWSADYNEAKESAAKKDPKLSEPALHKIGLEAVAKGFDKYLKVVIDGKQMDDKFKEQMSTTQSKVAQLNVNIQMIADATADKLLPAMLRLAPMVEKSAEAFSKLIIWAEGNKWEAITIAIGASIGKAAIGTTIQTAIEQSIHKGSGGVLGKLGASFMILAVAVAAVEVGMMMLDKAFRAEADRLNGRVTTGVTGQNIATTALSRGTMSPEDKASLDAAITKREEDKKFLQGGGWSETDKLANDALGALGVLRSDYKEAQQQAIKDHLENNNRELAAAVSELKLMREAQEAANKGVIKVEVQNPPKPDDGSSHPVSAKTGGH